ncbi:MAG TPA: GntR family transcriptional regulator [Firmicutes bacterium]|nr:GntR family transcriptional regulator [Bacillota bacterium]
MNILISSQNPSPLYQQIVDQIQRQILCGELAPGTALPSIRELARDLLTSVITVKRAYMELERSGLIITRSGVGSFVVDLKDSDRKKVLEQEGRLVLQAAVDKAWSMGLSAATIRSLVASMLSEKELEE